MEFGDYKPTDQSYVVFKDLSERLDKQLVQLDSIAKTDLAALNTMLVKKKIEAVRDGVPPVSETK